MLLLTTCLRSCSWTSVTARTLWRSEQECETFLRVKLSSPLEVCHHFTGTPRLGAVVVQHPVLLCVDDDRARGHDVPQVAHAALRVNVLSVLPRQQVTTNSIDIGLCRDRSL